MYYLESDKLINNSPLGRHFMSSLLWNTEPDKMMVVLKAMGNTYREYRLPIDYNALGIQEC